MSLGGYGVISTAANVCPGKVKQLVDLCAAGSFDEAASVNDKLMPLFEGLFKTTNPILVKEALRLCGFDAGGLRLPLVEATEEQSDDLLAVLKEVGVL